MIKTAFWNIDHNSVDIEMEDGCLLRLSCEAIEDTLNLSMTGRMHLTKLAEEKPLKYAELALKGELGQYIDLICRGSKSLRDNLYTQFRERYPDMSDTQIRGMVREFEMYES